MSLESNVGDLVTATNALTTEVRGKMAGIDSAVAKAIAAVPVNKRTWYINQLTGSDTNDGTPSAPLKSVEKAIANTPVGGFCVVLLQADYDMTGDIALEARSLEWRTDSIGTKRNLRPIYITGSDSVMKVMSGVICSIGSMMALRDVTLTLPSATGVLPAPVGFLNSFFKGAGTGGSPMIGLKLTTVDVVDAPGANGSLCGQGTCGLSLQVTGTTFPSGFAGRYVFGVPAATAANTLTNVLTNLSTL
ncbi:hypothetical protein D3C77_244250 [compost metagenome]